MDPLFHGTDAPLPRASNGVMPDAHPAGQAIARAGTARTRTHGLLFGCFPLAGKAGLSSDASDAGEVRAIARELDKIAARWQQSGNRDRDAWALSSQLGISIDRIVKTGARIGSGFKGVGTVCGQAVAQVRQLEWLAECLKSCEDKDLWRQGDTAAAIYCVDMLKWNVTIVLRERAEGQPVVTQEQFARPNGSQIESDRG